jgi:hypothetical protein
MNKPRGRNLCENGSHPGINIRAIPTSQKLTPLEKRGTLYRASQPGPGRVRAWRFARAVGGLWRGGDLQSSWASPLRTVDKLCRRRDAYSQRLGTRWGGLSGGGFWGFLGYLLGGVSVGRRGQELQGYEGCMRTLARKQFLAATSCCARLLARTCGCAPVWARHQARALRRPRQRLAELDT